ncbi:hypothetical protein JCM8097_009568 [Rhodosporidiobolus ruineniae]
MLLLPLLALAAPVAVLAQSTVSSTSTGAPTSSLNSTSPSTTLTGTVVSVTSSAASSTSTSLPPAPTANSTTSASQEVQLWITSGELTMCEMATFAFTGPAVSKSCGVFVTNTSTYLQQIPLGGTFSSLTAGTFSWLVDLPAGLSVEVQFWVTINGGVQQYTVHNQVVKDSGNNSCLATGSGQNTLSIISYASYLNESYTYTAPSASSTSHKSSNAGAIAGGVVGACAGLALVVLIAYFFYRRRKFSVPPPPSGFDGEGEDGKAYGAWPAEGSVAGGQYGQSTYAQRMVQQYSGQGQVQAVAPGGVVPYQARPTAAEPMPSTTSSPPPTSPSPGNEYGHCSTRGTEGLEDPSAFLARSTGPGSPRNTA